MANNNSANNRYYNSGRQNRPYSTLHSPDEYEQPQPSPYSNSLHTPVDPAPTPSFPPSPHASEHPDHQHAYAHAFSPPPQQSPEYMTPTHPTPPTASPYYLPPPSAPSHSTSAYTASQYYQPQSHQYGVASPVSPPTMASTPAPTTTTEYYSPPASPGIPPPSSPGAAPVEQYQLQHTNPHSPAPEQYHLQHNNPHSPPPPHSPQPDAEQYQLHSAHPSSPAPEYPPPPTTALNPSSQPRRPPVPPEPISTTPYNPSSSDSPTTGPQTPKTPIYTPAASAGPNGGIHAPGQIAHPNQQLSSEKYHHGLCDCFSDLSSCCMGYWCPCILYSRTYHRLKTSPNSNLNDFRSCNSHCAAFCVLAPVSWVLTMLQRSRIRENYKLEGSLPGDCARAYCCVACTLVQDEREVRDREDERRRFAGPGSGVVGDTGYRRQGGMVYGGV